MTKTVLLAIGPGGLLDGIAERVEYALRDENAQDAVLELLLFREDGDQSLESALREVWRGAVVVREGAKLFAEIDEDVRSSLTSFVSGLREKLTAIAWDVGGRKWAARFGSLWWKSRVSEKNSPADDMWWQMFRAAALERALSNGAYESCMLVGDDWFVHLGRQAAARNAIACKTIVTASHRFSMARALAVRMAEGYCYLRASMIAKRSGGLLDRLVRSEKPLVLLYTLFPRVWTDRFGGWKDMYYGRLPDTLRVEVSCDVAYALRIFDGRGIMKPAEYRNRLDSLSDPAKSPSSFVVLERFVGWKDVLRRYLGFGDALRYWRMSRHPEFDAAFDWNGMDVRLLLQDRMRRSAVVYWPMLQVFETSVRRALNAANPAAIVAYHFEFADGRAFISGCRDARPETPVVGVQHGPITSMKMLYSAASSDYYPTAFGGGPLPEPDVYVVDGDAPAEIMRRASIAPERVVTTGAVRFDDVWDEIRSMPRLRERRERVRLLVAPGLHDTENVVKLVSKALGHDDRLELVIKPHPRVDPALVDRWLQATGTGPGGAAVSVVRDGTIYQWMTQSDLFLATYSSTAIEALAFGLPVVLMLPNDSPDMSLYKGLDVPVLTACNAEELRGHVQHLLSAPELMDEYTRRLVPALRRCFGPDDSESSRRLAEVCRGLLAESGIQRREQVVAK